MKGRIFQINRSNGGLPKLACLEVDLAELGLAGDHQRSTGIHGGPMRALCLYSLERILALQEEGHPVFAGGMGENLTIAGLDWTQVEPGQRYQIGERIQIEITKYTSPCNNLIPLFTGGDYGRVSQTRHPGWSRVYARVLEVGKIKVGDPIRLIKGV